MDRPAAIALQSSAFHPGNSGFSKTNKNPLGPLPGYFRFNRRLAAQA